MISLSVVIPTHNRAALLPRTLESLARQDLAVSEYEVIVVADGCTDGTMQLLRSWKAPFALMPIEQTPGRGAAAARNAGAERASAELVLFLDDDMEASRRLLSEHVLSHRQQPGRVVLGYFPMQPPAPDDDVFTKAVRIWWADEFANRSHQGHRYTFKDLCTGNVSLARDLFLELGGFDEQIGRGAGEDYELGYRLIQRGIRFRYVAKAASIHHTIQPLAVNLRRAEQEGYGQALVVRRHPELFWSFNISVLSRLTDSVLLHPIWRAVWKWPVLLALPAAVLRALVKFLASAGLYSLLWGFHRSLRGYYYWRGAREALGSLDAWERLAQDAPIELPGAQELDFDVFRDLPRMDELMARSRVDAVRVWHDGEPVGRIPSCAGAEPLTGEHIRNILIQRFTGVLLSVITRQQMATMAMPNGSSRQTERQNISTSATNE